MTKKTLTPGAGFDLNNPNEEAAVDGPVECLGKTFANDAERREFYLQILAEKLKDPEFRKIAGFPIGEDIDILNLSDPPYYTACPNPFIADFISHYGRPYDSSEIYKREPYAADVSEGKNDPIYNAHSYHTKVPHKAIMRYILHYTNPADVVFDGFCGTGMTGVAAQMCGDRGAVESLGYRVLPDTTILQEVKDDETGKLMWIPFSKLGSRVAVLNDLSPAATFISSNYNYPVDLILFNGQSNKIVEDITKEFGWMYETIHTDKKTKGVINFTLWSDLFGCPECAGDLIFWDVAIDSEKGSVKDEFECPHCSSLLNKRKLDRIWETKHDDLLGITVKQIKQVPVLINYSIQGKAGRFEKRPDEYDFKLIDRVEKSVISSNIPITEILKGDKTGEPIRAGFSHVHHMYTKRNLTTLAKFYQVVGGIEKKSKHLGIWLTSSQVWGTKQNRLLTSNYFKKKGGVIGQTLQGTLYVSSLCIETNLIERFRLRISSVPYAAPGRDAIISTSSTSALKTLKPGSLDYIFIDPPFGSNLMYSELNIIWESWLGVKTNNIDEAIENKTQNKGADEYRNIMSRAFSVAYDALKPGRWMTVEFSNTSAKIWNIIQTSIVEAGFIVANVSALNKTHNGFNAVTNPTSVKQDLVISAYKPNGGFEARFINESDEEGVWDFIHTHLTYLPIYKKDGTEIVKVSERDPRLLFDQVVAYFVRNLRDVPLSSKEFQLGLRERFAERDGMIFLPEQVSLYDKVRITSTQLRQLAIFVDDEASAIEWLRQLLNDKPQTYQDVHPKFIHELSGWKKAEIQLELATLLEQNFLKFDGTGQIPAQIHSYLSTNFKEMRNLAKDDSALIQKAKDRWYVPNPDREEDLQKLRERSLLKQFEEYKNHSGKKLKLIRMEAVRAGFKKAWVDRDYKTIIEVAEKIPEDLLQEDQKLLMWYDQAQTRHSDSSLF